MTLFKLFFIPILFAFSSIQHLSDPPIKCEQVYQQAKKDHDQEQLKYYYFGIAQLPFTVVSEMKSKYQIEVIALGCMVNEAQICYNQQVDLILKAKTGKDFYGLLGTIK